MSSRNPDGKYQPPAKRTPPANAAANFEKYLEVRPGEPGPGNPLAGRKDWRIGKPWDPAWGPYPGGRPEGKESLSDLIQMALDEKVDVYYGGGKAERIERRKIWARHIVDMAVFGEIQLPSNDPLGVARTVRYSADSYAKHAIKLIRYLDPPVQEVINPAGVTNIIFDIPINYAKREEQVLLSQTVPIEISVKDTED